MTEAHVRVLPAPKWERPDYDVKEWTRRAVKALREHGPTVALAVCWYAAGQDEDGAVDDALQTRINDLIEQARMVDCLLGEAAA